MRDIIFDFPIVPPSVNTLWRIERGKARLSKEARDFYALVKLFVRGKRAPRAWRYYAVDILIEPSRRSGDVDNKIKAVLDSLTKAGFWKDDSLVAAVSCQFGKINRRGRTIVRVSERKSKFL